MSRDLGKLIFSTEDVSWKLIKEGDGTETIPASGVGLTTAAIATIPHGHDSDEIVVDVGIREPSTGGVYFTPFSSQAQTVKYLCYHDDTNVYIEGQQGGAAPRSALTFNYTYRIRIP